MKSHYLGVGVIGLALAGLWFAGGGTTPPAAQAGEQLRVAAPVSHDNLTVYFVHGPQAIDDSRVVGLQEAIEKKWVVVHETGEVNELSIENVSADRDVFVQSGDMIRGGKQDRLIATDLLVRPGAGKLPVPSHCVEQGRWTGRGAEATTHFNKSENFAVGNDIKLANAYRDQSKVWAEVANNQKKLTDNTGAKVADPQSPTSLQLSLENPVVQAKVSEYEQSLKASGENRAGVVGVVFVVNGKVSAAEVYGSSGLFQKAWPKLLRAASAEAIADKKAGENPAAPSCREVELFLASAATAEPTIPNREEINQTEGRVVQTEGRGGRGVGNRVQIQGNEVQVSDNVPNRGWVNLGGQMSTDVTAVNPARPQPQPPQLQNFSQSIVLSEPTPRAVQQDAIVVNPTVGNRRVNPANPNPSANPLATNRVDNRGSLMLESRDATQQNAVIHRSYIKK
jgi:hypothetical protein